MTKRALLIGINYFGTPSELRGCIQDIEDVKQYLESVGYTEFTILTDDGKNPEPTTKNILLAMYNLTEVTKRGDTLYVHYSGHGSHIDDQNGDEADGQDECICPSDYIHGFITDDTLNDILVKKLAAGAKLRVVFDSCHSGSALDLPVRWISGSIFANEKRPSLLPTALGDKVTLAVNKLKIPADVIFFSGCKDAQTSADAQFDSRNNGALTWAMLKTLNAVSKSKSPYSWKDLGEHIRLKLKKAGYDQIPQICAVNRSQINNIVDLIA